MDKVESQVHMQLILYFLLRLCKRKMVFGDMITRDGLKSESFLAIESKV